MDINSEFYKRIVYRKNAIDELSSYLKFYQKHKSVLFISDTNNDWSNQILAQVANSGNAFKYCFIDDNPSYNEIKLLYNKAKEVKLIIGYVSGYNANLIKYLSKANDSEFIFIPVSPSSTFYFLPYYYSPINKITAYESNYPTRIFIDERIIKDAPRSEILKGLELFLSYFELYFSLICENLLNEYKYDLFTFAKLLSRYEELFALFRNEEKEISLVLMDNLIELAYLTREIHLNNICFFNLSNLLISSKFLERENMSFESYSLIATDLLLNIYRQVFLQDNIKVLSIPNYDDIARLIEKYKFISNTYKGIEYYKNISSDKLSLINDKKLEIIEHLEAITKKVKRNIKHINKMKGTKIITTFHLDECYDSIRILPYIFNNNNLLDVVGGTGILNF